MAKCGVINSAWLAGERTNRLDAGFWLSVMESARHLGYTDLRALTNDDIRKILEHEDRVIEDLEDTIRIFRARAREFDAAARAIEENLPLGKARKPKQRVTFGHTFRDPK